MIVGIGTNAHRARSFLGTRARATTTWACRVLLTVLLLLAASSPAAAQEDPSDNRNDFPPIDVMAPKGVNLQTGRFQYTESLFSVGPLSFSVHWNSIENQLWAQPGGAYSPMGLWVHNQAGGLIWDYGQPQTYARVRVAGPRAAIRPYGRRPILCVERSCSGLEPSAKRGKFHGDK